MKRIFILFLFFITFTSLCAHTPLLIIEDSDDENVYIKAGFSNGQDAGGMTLFVKSKFDNRIIEQMKFPEISQLTLRIPAEPYYLVFDGGPGHKVVKNGPAPGTGFTVHSEAVNNKIPGQGMPLWLIITLIAAGITSGVFVKQKFFN